MLNTDWKHSTPRAFLIHKEGVGGTRTTPLASAISRRILREELRRNEECSRNARNVLRPVLANAWSNFFIAGDVPRKATSTHLWEGDGVECRRRDDLCWEEEEDGEEVRETGHDGLLLYFRVLARPEHSLCVYVMYWQYRCEV